MAPIKYERDIYEARGRVGNHDELGKAGKIRKEEISFMNP